MGSLLHPVNLRLSPRRPPLVSRRPIKPPSIPQTLTTLLASRPRFPRVWSPSSEPHLPSLSPSGVGSTEEESSEFVIETLKVPESWLLPSNALQESEWLRVALHKWLDDEYCPEPANVEISIVAARSYHESLISKKADLGDILLNMVGDLQTLSFQESFHGVFSSANAAVHLIALRINTVEEQ